MLEFEAVSKRFPDGTHALKELSFGVPEGQFCVLLGSSGAGKSTLLRSINGLIELSSGQVRVDGVTVTRKTIREVRSRISMIHQNFNLVPRLSVEKNVLTGALGSMPLMPALTHLFPKDLRRKACHLIDSVGLEEKHLDRRATELSGGQQQRVGIARAFILDPSIVLADEPVASLDPKISRDILQILRDAAQQRGATVVCSLHQIELAQEFGERIVGLSHGKIVFDGKPEELTTDILTEIYGEEIPWNGSDPSKESRIAAPDTKIPEPVCL